jgi:hypothetical protein
MSLKYKLTLFIIFILIYISIISFFWPNIQVSLLDNNGSIGLLTTKKINPINDTVRFVLLIFPPLILNFFFIKVYFKENFSKINSLIYCDKISENSLELKDLKLIFPLFFFLIIFDFFQTDFPHINYLDTLHDGDYLAAISNHLHYGGFWNSAFTVHGGENIFLPLIAYKFLNLNIASIVYTPYIAIFLIKFLTVILSYQISQITNVEKNYKIIFFVILSIFMLSLSSYGEVNYINIRDLFVLIFFTILIRMYINKLNILLIYLLSLATVLSFIFHYDTGVYLHVVALLIIFHFLFSKKIKESSLLIIFLIVNWLIVFGYFGYSEITSMFDQFLQMAMNMDKMHGLEYPQPFLSIGDGNDGTRGTKALVFLLILGFITTAIVFFKNNYFKMNEKFLLIIFYTYSIISFKNALGRSDGPHIMLSSDWISILLCFYFLNLFFFYSSKYIKLQQNIKYIEKIAAIFLIILISINTDFKKFLNYKLNFEKYININDKTLITDERMKIIQEISQFISNENCIQNFTADLSLPYLLGKPNCTQFISPWLASGEKFEKKFIDQLQNNKVNYIIYNSPLDLVDGIKTSDRLKIANNFLQKNYEIIWRKNNYILLKKI